jgi:DNA polymerase-3 subunit gamma/tau
VEAISIVQRPKTWDEIIGQDRALRVLKDILRNGKFAPRAIILEGPYGVGKTTTGYITAKALMCIGDNKLGCGVCASCLVFQEHADAHPEFREVDAASHSGVGETRKLVEEAMELPTLSKTRVILIDEAHRLSGEAWDVYLKPLEQIDTKAVFIFATTDAKRIPAKIRSRCVVIRFSRVALDIMTGYLVSIASKMQLDYELDGLKLLARAAKGHIRSALILLDKVSAMGKVTKELAASVVDTSYSDMALNSSIWPPTGSIRPSSPLTRWPCPNRCLKPSPKFSQPTGERFSVTGISHLKRLSDTLPSRPTSHSTPGSPRC